MTETNIHSLTYLRITTLSVPREYLEKIEMIDAGYETECWEWQGARTGDGYAVIGRELGHRLFYRLYVGEIEEETIHHLCENPPCIRPEHLVPVSRAENIRLKQVSQAKKLAEEHELTLHTDLSVCIYGHPSPGRGKCGPCSNIRMTAWHAATRTIVEKNKEEFDLVKDKKRGELLAQEQEQV